MLAIQDDADGLPAYLRYRGLDGIPIIQDGLAAPGHRALAAVAMVCGQEVCLYDRDMSGSSIWCPVAKYFPDGTVSRAVQS
ncbi:MAG: hypothetical protein PHR51_01310 [Patescibacteria group bacterium]|nr:hypothetical protein [Patescibacteria group bacterium]